MKTIYLAHPISNDVAANLKDIARIIRVIMLEHPDVIPVCPYFAFVHALDDSIPAERAAGMRANEFLLRIMFFSEVWLCGSFISPGMEAERLIAVEEGIVVKDKIGII